MAQVLGSRGVRMGGSSVSRHTIAGNVSLFEEMMMENLLFGVGDCDREGCLPW